MHECPECGEPMKRENMVNVGVNIGGWFCDACGYADWDKIADDDLEYEP